VYGVILDTVTEVSQNLSPINFKDLILTVLSAELAIGSNVKFINLSLQDLEAAVHHINDWIDSSEGPRVDEISFGSLICTWMLFDLRLLTERAPTWKHQIGYHASEWYKDYLTEGISYDELICKDEKLKWMYNQARVVQWDAAESTLAGYLFLNEGGLGRNLFRSKKGYRGVGPAGVNSEGSTPAVQIGDHITLARSAAPVILRPLEAGHYTLIGSAHIADLENAPFFQQGEISELEEIRIR
jgi:hypothetical protein